MPSRIVREGILTSLAVDKLSSGAEVFYRRMLNVVDDFGRYHGIPSLLRAAAFPLKIDKVLDKHIDQWIRECADAGLLKHYVVDGLPYVEVAKFGKPRATESKYPAPPVDENKRKQTQTNASKSTVVVVEDVVVSDVTTLPADKPPVPRRPHWSEPQGSVLKALPGCPTKGPWSYLGRLANEHTKLVVQQALGRMPEFTNWNHATGWLKDACRNGQSGYAPNNPRMFKAAMEDADDYKGR